MPYPVRDGFWEDKDPAFPNKRFAPKPKKGALEPQAAHDAAHGPPEKWPRIRSGWVAEKLMPTEPLTDKRIEARRKQGYFSDAHKEAMRNLRILTQAKMKEQEDAEG